VTDEEHDLLQMIYAEAQGQAEKWIAPTELPFAALALSRNGYINRYQEAGADVWHVALTESGRALALQLAAK
jgi:hypothetical protein